MLYLSISFHASSPRATFMQWGVPRIVRGLVCMLAQAANDLYLMFLHYEVHSVNSYWGCVSFFCYIAN